MFGENVKIRIFEGRWLARDGEIMWNSRRREQVVTLQDHVIEQMPTYIQEGLFKNINERVWPTSRNIPIREVEDRLFELIQPFVKSEIIELIPENLHEQSECLIKGDFDLLLGADGAESFVRNYCNIGVFVEGIEYACGVAYNIPEQVEPSDEPLHQALNCILTISQTRYLVNSSTSRQGFLNIRLTKVEYAELEKSLKSIQINHNGILDLYNLDQCPYSPIWTIIRQGLAFFRIGQKYVKRVQPIEIKVRHAAIAVRELKYQQEKNYKTALAFLAGDSLMNVHFWPGRGMNSGMKAAVALARNILTVCTNPTNNQIQIQTPLKFLDFLTYEGFMARLRAREQQGRSLRVLNNPIDSALEQSYNSLRSMEFEVYKEQLETKLRETRNRLENREDWPHSPKHHVSDEDIHRATNRIIYTAVQELNLANPWPTREMSGQEVLIQDTYPNETIHYFTVPTKILVPKPSLSTRTANIHRRIIILWIKTEAKHELLINSIENSPKFLSTVPAFRRNELHVVRSITEITQWLNDRKTLVNLPITRFKVIIDQQPTSLELVELVRTYAKHAPILIFTKEEETITLDFPNILLTHLVVDIYEFVELTVDPQWKEGLSAEKSIN
ncbi:unnamed protein product [Didymodactylos carnosus]|uniref:Uncharacterized protein n=1 Tax=Didymodactylos carnosus TaxID=1234261 RepID=A0A814ATF4_9BILA|nr:unnamed protein product [Didymodactylos carnosus]CAF1139214.1 unnamed protein product [Didymodactylos carnosus]CAF3699096.1 unnamed protein product [Didymodactylos carnosus]CAF3932038.1 unnamed protein product [Didymodactylos carnosus]